MKQDDGSDSGSSSSSSAGPSSTYQEETFDESDLVIPEIDLGPDDEESSTSSNPPAIDESVMEGSEESTNDATGDQAPAITEPDADTSEGFRVPIEPLPTQPPADTPEPKVIDLEDITRDEVPANDIRVARIVLNSRLSGGYDFDGKPGDDGLLLVIEPQNTAGQYLPLPGDLTITVEDPRRAGADARVARWDFNAVETVDHMKKTLLGRGIHLKLPWPNQPPDQTTLKVFATYQSTDGRQLDTSRTVRVDLGSNRDPIAGSAPAAPFQTRLLPKNRQATRSDLSVSSLPAPPRAPSPKLRGKNNESRLAQQPWQPSRSKNQAAPRQKERPPSAGRSNQPKWRPYR